LAGTNAWSSSAVEVWSPTGAPCAAWGFQRQQDPPFGLIAVSPLDPSRVLACPYGLSDRGGFGWRQALARDAAVSGFAFSQSDPTRVFGINDQGNPMRSLDSGETWAALDGAPEDVASFVTSPTGMLYLLADNSLFRGQESGSEWSSITPPESALGGSFNTIERVTSLAVDPADARTLYAGVVSRMGGSLLRSLDGGDSWASLGENDGKEPPRPFNSEIFEILIHPGNRDQIYLNVGGFPKASSDRGQSWEDRGWFNHNVYDLELDPGDSMSLLAASYDGVASSHDGGRSWQPLANIEGPAYHLIRHPLRPSQIYVLTDAGLLRSTDGGQSWAAAMFDLGYTFPADIAWSESDPRVVYAALYDSLRPPQSSAKPPLVLRSSDQGWTWQPAGEGLPTGLISMRIVVAPTDPDLVALIDRSGQLWITRDAGASWTRHQLLATDVDASEIAFATRDSSMMFALTQSGRSSSPVLRSMSRGIIWQPAGQGLPDWFGTDFRTLTLSSADPERLYLLVETRGAPDAFYRSENAAESWIRAEGAGLPDEAKITAFDLSPSDADHLLALLDEGIYESRSAGDSWSRVGDVPTPSLELALETEPTIRFDRQDPSRLILAGKGLYSSHDAGRSWTEHGARPPLPSDLPAFPAMDPSGTGTILAMASEALVHFQPHEDPEPLRAWLPAGGALSTDSELESEPGASPADPIELSVISPKPGWIELEEGHTLPEGADDGILPVTARFALPETTSEDPWVAVIRIDGSVLPEGVPAAEIGLLQDNQRVADCLPGVTAALPAPCVAARRVAGDDYALTIRATLAAHWTFDLGGARSEARRIFLPKVGG
jgi:photosystem II stability/assembly factor-like uncharacterized protein